MDIFVFMSQMGDDYKELVRNQKNMVCGHFAQVQNCDNDIKINFIHHMQQSNTFIPVKIRFKSGDSELQMESLESVVSNTINVFSSCNTGKCKY